MSLRDILQDFFDEMLSEGVFARPRFTIDQVVYCEIDNEDEFTELATTNLTFIVQAIIEGGKPTNRYVVTWEVVE